MSPVQTPQYLQEKGIPARFDRQLLADFFSPGVISATDMVVTSTGGARSVSISKGVCYVAGTQNTDQGTYRCFNDGPLVRTFDPAVTFPRLDQLVVRVYDSTELGSGALDYGDIEIVKGTEANGATVLNRSGAVADNALPANSIRIYDVLVPVGASPVIPSANIVDRRTYAGLRAGGAAPIGACIPYTMATEPTDGHWSLADGGLIDKTVYGQFFAGAQHAYNNGVDPGSNKVRKPDKRGRGSVGADNMGTSAHSGTAGAAGRLTIAAGHQNARGQNGGSETVQLSGTQHGDHIHSDGTLYAADHQHRHISPIGLRSGTTRVKEPNEASLDWNGSSYSYMDAPGDNGVDIGAATGSLSERHLVTSTTATANGVDGATGNSTGFGVGTPHENMHNYEVDLWIVRIA